MFPPSFPFFKSSFPRSAHDALAKREREEGWFSPPLSLPPTRGRGREKGTRKHRRSSFGKERRRIEGGRKTCFPTLLRSCRASLPQLVLRRRRGRSRRGVLSHIWRQECVTKSRLAYVRRCRVRVCLQSPNKHIYLPPPPTPLFLIIFSPILSLRRESVRYIFACLPSGEGGEKIKASSPTQPTPPTAATRWAV